MEKKRGKKLFIIFFSCGLIDLINNDTIAGRDYLKEGQPADNDSIRKLNVKAIVTTLIDTAGVGLDLYKLNQYIDMIPSSEISEDIENMYNFIVGELK